MKIHDVSVYPLKMPYFISLLCHALFLFYNNNTAFIGLESNVTSKLFHKYLEMIGINSTLEPHLASIGVSLKIISQ